MKAKEITWIVDDNGCWICNSHKCGIKGYPQKKINGRATRINRIMYAKYNGELIEGMEVMHSCDNNMCINPKHLSLGTHKENMQQMAERNRALSGVNHKDAKLTENDIREIRVSKLSDRVLGLLYGVDHSGINKIKNNKIWKGVI